jgi:hypothetical protein
VPSRSAVFAFVVCALTFYGARCQSAYEPILNPASDKTQSFHSGQLGISLTYPLSMVSVPVFLPELEDQVPKKGIENRTECLKSTGQNDLVAVRNMRTDDPDALTRARREPEAAKALITEEEKWPGIVARLAISHIGLACMPPDVYAHLMNGELNYLPGGVPNTGAMHTDYLYPLVVGDTSALFSAAEFSKPDARDGRYWLANITFVRNDYIVLITISSNDRDFFNLLLREEMTVGENDPAPLLPGGFNPDRADPRFSQGVM